jgi:RHS repeat-associated protein
MPGSYGFTGQRADSATGLDYYNARYYDPVAGQFTSADSVQDGLNRYAYVAGNPETRTDPSGHIINCGKFIGSRALSDGLGCAGDLLFGAAAIAQGHATQQLFDKVGQRFGSGNTRYLNEAGEVAFEKLKGTGAWLRRGVRTFDVRNLWGGGRSATDVAADDLKDLIKPSSEFIKDMGVGGGDISRDMSHLRGAIDDVSGGLKGWSRVGEGATIVGAALVTVLSGVDDFQEHHNGARAVGVGLLHGVLSTGGAYLGGAIGASAGVLCGPLAWACAPAFGFLGASAGGAIGDWAATQIVNQCNWSGELRSEGLTGEDGLQGR